MLLALFASVVIASCFDGDTCTTTAGERIRLACIDTPELTGERAQPLTAEAARDYLRGLVVGEAVLIDQAAGRSFASAPPCMEVPPRTPKDRAAVAQRTHHPANSELKRRAAPSTQALRTTTSKT